jgi:hypothetical protein
MRHPLSGRRVVASGETHHTTSGVGVVLDWVRNFDVPPDHFLPLAVLEAEYPDFYHDGTWCPVALDELVWVQQDGEPFNYILSLSRDLIPAEVPDSFTRLDAGDKWRAEVPVDDEGNNYPFALCSRIRESHPEVADLSLPQAVQGSPLVTFSAMFSYTDKDIQQDFLCGFLEVLTPSGGRQGVLLRIPGVVLDHWHATLHEEGGEG